MLTLYSLPTDQQSPIIICLQKSIQAMIKRQTIEENLQLQINKNNKVLRIDQLDNKFESFILIMMASIPSPELLLSLQQYIVELETENKSLKDHIFQIQDRAENSRLTFHDELEKLKLYTQQCQNEIGKRQNREMGLIQLVNELQSARQQITQQRDMYIQQIGVLKEEIDKKEKEIVGLSMQLEILKRDSANQKQILAMPPKSSKCKNCETFLRNNQMYQKQILGYNETIKQLQKDIQCLCQFI